MSLKTQLIKLGFFLHFIKNLRIKCVLAGLYLLIYPSLLNIETVFNEKIPTKSSGSLHNDIGIDVASSYWIFIT